MQNVQCAATGMGCECGEFLETIEQRGAIKIREEMLAFGLSRHVEINLVIRIGLADIAPKDFEAQRIGEFHFLNLPDRQGIALSGYKIPNGF